jgi:hypothetical protein
MKDANSFSADRLYLSPGALKSARLPAHLRKGIRDANVQALCAPVAVACASEVLNGRAKLDVPAGDSETRYLVLIDVPLPALIHLTRKLGVSRPDYRLYQTSDVGAIRRLLIGLSRKQPVLGIVDAYVLGGDLHVLTADFEQRCFPFRKLPLLARLNAATRARLAVDEDGSFLHWAEQDLHVGVSQLLQEVDPAFMADIAIERNERDKVGVAVRLMREERSLTQSDIPGISVRQVSRIEGGVSRLRYAAAQRFAEAFRMDTGAFLNEVGQRAASIRAASSRPRMVRRRRSRAPTGSAIGE